MRMLITGGCGFVGQYLADVAHGAGHQVALLDDLSGGVRRGVRDGVWSGPSCADLFVGSTHDEDLVRKLVRGSDVVVHLQRSHAASAREALADERKGLEVVLTACGEQEKKVVVASSSSVYGENEAIEVSEHDNTGSASESPLHRTIELMKEHTVAAHRALGLEVVVARMFNVVGPGARGSVLHTLVEQALDAAPLTVHGDGRQVRAFVHVEDAARALAQLCSAADLEGYVVNVGADSAVSILGLARRVKQLTRSRAPIVRMLSADGPHEMLSDLRSRIPRLRRLRRAIGWVPSLDLDRAIVDVLRDVRGQS